jgi:hypothetical protein
MSGAPLSGKARLRQPGAAYLLSQVGAHSSRRWHERLQPLGLDPRQVVVLRMVAANRAGISVHSGRPLRFRTVASLPSSTGWRNEGS